MDIQKPHGIGTSSGFLRSGVDSVEKTASSRENKAITFRKTLIRFFHPPEKKTAQHENRIPPMKSL